MVSISKGALQGFLTLLQIGFLSHKMSLCLSMAELKLDIERDAKQSLSMLHLQHQLRQFPCVSGIST
jgi:hypothetical protein